MERKVVELVKSALKKMTNREKKLFLRLLSEELAKELIRRRRLRKQEDPASKIIEVLDSIKFDWDDFFKIVDGCHKEKCPVEEHLYEEHPYTIDREGSMNFRNAIRRSDRWVNDLTTEELGTFLEDERQQNKVRDFLKTIMNSKFDEAVDEVKSRLEEIEKLVDEEMELEEVGDEIRSHLYEVSEIFDNIAERGPEDDDIDFFFNELKDFLEGVYYRMVEREEE